MSWRKWSRGFIIWRPCFLRPPSNRPRGRCGPDGANTAVKTPPALLPDLQTLAARLTAALGGGVSLDQPVVILDRSLPRMMSTFPNEIVTLRWRDDRARRVFIKYEGGRTHNAFGHRGGVAYEAEVYRQVLRFWPESPPRFLGAHTHRATGDTWLFLEYLNRSGRVRDL